MTKKLPTKLYVTAKVDAAHPLGFLNAYEPGKAAFEAKRITQEKWAYFDHSNVRDGKIEQRGNDWWLTGYVWNFANGAIVEEPVQRLLDYPPAIWDNTPLAEFKVLKSVSRWSTSNKLWRILDPRGVQFEITTSCMEKIIDDAGILKGGTIDGLCAWMGNKNLVVP